MRALVLFPLLLCAVASVVQVGAEVKAVKLCGREFLRAVVYTCGGSRWRRFPVESDTDGETNSVFNVKAADTKKKSLIKHTELSFSSGAG